MTKKSNSPLAVTHYIEAPLSLKHVDLGALQEYIE
jgi:hypothetical protein